MLIETEARAKEYLLYIMGCCRHFPAAFISRNLLDEVAVWSERLH